MLNSISKQTRRSNAHVRSRVQEAAYVAKRLSDRLRIYAESVASVDDSTTFSPKEATAYRDKLSALLYDIERSQRDLNNALRMLSVHEAALAICAEVSEDEMFCSVYEAAERFLQGRAPTLSAKALRKLELSDDDCAEILAGIGIPDTHPLTSDFKAEMHKAFAQAVEDELESRRLDGERGIPGF